MQINLDHNKKYLLACSYGPDSMALFSLLLKGNYNFVVAHINYGLRGEESEKETNDLALYCKEHNIAFFVKWVNGKKIKGNFQNEARKVRYEFFEEIIKEHDFDALLTAHHADDVIETYLMQQNSKRETFYYGIREEIVLNNSLVIRPLLNYYKNDLVFYCVEHKVPFAVDSSNLELTYTRNKIRHNLVKKMSVEQKDKLLLDIKGRNKDLKAMTNKLELLLENSTISITEFIKLNNREQQHLLYMLFHNKGIADEFSKGRNNQIKDVVLSDKNSAMIKVIDSYYLVKYEDKFSLININNYQPYKYIVETPETIKTPQFVAFFGKNNVFPNIPASEYPLTIATQGKNQKYKIKGYEKTINRLFIDMKMPRHYRLIWPVVTNKNGEVIYVPRYRANYIPKATDLFKIYIK